MASLLQHALSSQSSSTPEGVVDSPVSHQLPHFHDVTSPNPEKFPGEVGNCRGFLLQCSLVFNRSPQSFLYDDVKISFILGLLGLLIWAEARFIDYNQFGCTYKEFVQEFKH
ncbi:hypothetical protein ILYODFUR_017863 [Ilyodon furcidens]|uniref:Uncharacterized protein n=1 Tax=Ilyodon furcidens TaxID=33524 RepID=A0ABV0VHX3_9TELE